MIDTSFGGVWPEARRADVAIRELVRQAWSRRTTGAEAWLSELGWPELLDYDLAANNGAWQWCASTGCDAQPCFRIFSPLAHSRRFDPRGAYIGRPLPDLARVPAALIHTPWQMAAHEQRATRCVMHRDHWAPVVDHAEARRAALARYSAVGSR